MSQPSFVTAASHAYFRCLQQLLCSLQRHEPDLTGTVYDLGLSEAQRAWLTRRFPDYTLLRFDFSGQPEHVHIRKRAINSNAWKPLLLDRMLEQATGPVLWLDSATVICAPLAALFAWIARTGLYTPFGGASTIAQLTHPATLRFLHVASEVACQRQRASGVFGVDPAAPAGRSLVADWARLASIPECIAPAGATLVNHRFDQSLLNVLLYALAQAEPTVQLTRDAIDVSSSRPCALYRTRNKVRNDVPLALDPLVRGLFVCRRALDVALLRLRA